MMLKLSIVALAGLLMAGDSVARAVTAPIGVDDTEDMAPRRPDALPAAVAPRASAAVAHVPSGNPLWAIPLRQLTATRERPLFAPSRRPPPPVVATQHQMPPAPPLPPKPVEPEKPSLMLVGTIARGTAERIGIFFDSAARSVVRLRAGEAHKGWILHAVQRREVVLVKGAQSTVLALPEPDISKPTLAAPGVGRLPPGSSDRTGDKAPLATGSAAPYGGASPMGLGFGRPMEPPQFRPAAAPLSPGRDQPGREPPPPVPDGRS